MMIYTHASHHLLRYGCVMGIQEKWGKKTMMIYARHKRRQGAVRCNAMAVMWWCAYVMGLQDLMIYYSCNRCSRGHRSNWAICPFEIEYAGSGLIFIVYGLYSLYPPLVEMEICALRSKARINLKVTGNQQKK